MTPGTRDDLHDGTTTFAPPARRRSIRLSAVAAFFGFWGWVTALYAVLLIPAAFWDGFPFLRFMIDKPIQMLAIFVTPIALIAIGRDLANRRRRGAIGAFVFIVLSHLATPAHRGERIEYLMGFVLALLVLSVSRELE